MAVFKVEWKASVDRDLEKLHPAQTPSILKKLESLAENPVPRGCKKLVETERTYRIRVGNYRIIYQIDYARKVIMIYYIRHRKDAYI